MLSEPARAAAGSVIASQPARPTERVSVANIFKGVWDVEEDREEEIEEEEGEEETLAEPEVGSLREHW